MGINSLIFTTDNFPVPNEWIFENFLNLKEKLTGQSVSIKSIFNENDTNPSMILYLHSNNKYKFKDFSSGLQGDAVDMIQYLYGLNTRNEAFQKVYEFWKDGGIDTYVNSPLIKKVYEISDYKIRQWNTDDVKYWTQFHLGSDDLNPDIKPLEFYTFKVTHGDKVDYLKFENSNCYGFFNKKNELYKIYNPLNVTNRKAKFIKVLNYIQGSDELEYKTPLLLIVSSLKDLKVFKKLKIPGIELIAPDSENVILNLDQIEFYKSKYKYIATLLDNDTAGKKAMILYKNTYNIPFVEFDVEKDIALSAKEHGLKNTRIFMMNSLKKMFKHFGNT